MQPILQTGVVATDQEIGVIGDRRAERLDPGFLALGEIIQHIGMNQRLVAGVTDAKPQAFVVIADMGRDGAQAIMTGDAAPGFDPAFGWSEVELIMQDHDVVETDLMEARRLANRTTTFVHVGLGLKQHYPFTGDGALADKPLKARAGRWKAVPPGDGVNRHEANVMTVAGVGSTGISEPDKEQHEAPQQKIAK